MKFFIAFLIGITAPLGAQKETLKVVSSVPPLSYIVKEIGQERVSACTIVPRGTSPHSFEPTVKQTLQACEAKIWFRVGEPFEEWLENALKPCFQKPDFIDVQKSVTLLPRGCKCDCEEIFDSHIWFSLKELKKVAQVVCQVLASHDPFGKEIYEQNLAKFLGHILKLEQKILNEQWKETAFVTSHAAFGYLCRDYGLTQMTLETEGGELSPKQLTALITRAKERRVSHVFVQPQYNPKGARKVAALLNAEVVVIDPYEENMLKNIETIVGALSERS
ncbi:MAG: zinc ABC transporter substrate-binding protein [Chlamydiia bacterium]|nr:zinc ABC transporter substrate-binding protein [Chlamydiia bacterium]